MQCVKWAFIVPTLSSAARACGVRTGIPSRLDLSTHLQLLEEGYYSYLASLVLLPSLLLYISCCASSFHFRQHPLLEPFLSAVTSLKDPAGSCLYFYIQLPTTSTDHRFGQTGQTDRQQTDRRAQSLSNSPEDYTACLPDFESAWLYTTTTLRTKGNSSNQPWPRWKLRQPLAMSSRLSLSLLSRLEAFTCGRGLGLTCSHVGWLQTGQCLCGQQHCLL